MILADECVNGFLVRDLREAGFDIEWIVEIAAGIPDIDVIAHAKRNKQILITEDKDFGEWVFAHKITGLNIIFLRYDKTHYNQIVAFLKELIPTLIDDSSYYFITINKIKLENELSNAFSTSP